MSSGITEQEEEVKIRAVQDYINGVMAQNSTRRIFGGMMLAADIFFDLNVNHPELLGFLVKNQRDYAKPLNREEFPVAFDQEPRILRDLKLIGVLSPIPKADRETYNLVSKAELRIPPIKTSQHRYMTYRFSPAYLISVVGLPRPSGYRALKALRNMTLNLEFFLEKTDSGIQVHPQEETYPLIESLTNSSSKKNYLQFYMEGYENVLILPDQQLKRFYEFVRLELLNLYTIRELELLIEELEMKFNRFKYETVDAALTYQVQYAARQNSADPEIAELVAKSKDEVFKNALNDWKNRLETVDITLKLLKKLIKAHKSHETTFQKKNIDHLNKLYDSTENMIEHLNNELLKYTFQALQESSKKVVYNTETEITQLADHYLREPLSGQMLVSYSEIERFYRRAYGRIDA